MPHLRRAPPPSPVPQMTGQELSNLFERPARLRDLRSVLEDVPQAFPEVQAHIDAGAALAAELSFNVEAAARCNEVLDLDPHFSTGLIVRSQGLKNAAKGTRLLKALMVAGLPE